MSRTTRTTLQGAAPDAERLLAAVEGMGYTLFAKEGEESIFYSPAKMPADVLAQIKRCKPDLLRMLRERQRLEIVN